MNVTDNNISRRLRPPFCMEVFRGKYGLWLPGAESGTDSAENVLLFGKDGPLCRMERNFFIFVILLRL